MDPRLWEASVRGDLSAFLNLIKENANVLLQTTVPSSNTVLHLCSTFGHVDLVSEIIKQRPEMLSKENENKETPLHQACRQGHVEVVTLLLETHPLSAYKLNGERESALFIACTSGHLEVANYLLKKKMPQFLVSEEDSSSTSLHVAASRGDAAIVEEILKGHKGLAWKRDYDGFSPLHLASMKGHLEITRQLLRIDSSLCFLKDSDGRIPLHLAAISGHVEILDVILSAIPASGSIRTLRGETILHLGVIHNQYNAVKYMLEKLDIASLINSHDNNRNSPIHLADKGKLIDMMELLRSKNNVDANAGLDIIKEEDGAPVEMQEGTDILKTPSKGKGRRGPNKGSSDEKEVEAVQTTLVVVVLIASVTFQAGLNPPTNSTHISREEARIYFNIFMISNTIGFASSTFAILFSIIPTILIIPGRFARSIRSICIPLMAPMTFLATFSMLMTYLSGLSLTNDKELAEEMTFWLICIIYGATAISPLMMWVVRVKQYARCAKTSEATRI